MYELIYLDPLTNEPIIETNHEAVSYSTIGVMIDFGAVSSRLIPWHRVMGITGVNEGLRELMNYAAFGG